MKKDMKKDLLITLADRNYLEQAKQLFYGAVTKGGWQGELLLMAYEVSDAELGWFRERGIHIYHCEPMQVESCTDGRYVWPPVVWHKFQILKPYFRQWENILYLDGDIIVRSSIRALARVDGFSAVVCNPHVSYEFMDLVTAYLKDADWRSRLELGRKFDMGKKAFNAGVLAFPSSMIEDDMFDRAYALVQKYGGLSYTSDQAIWNIFIAHWNPLPMAYNIYPFVIYRMNDVAPADIRGAIIHFVLDKPWSVTDPFYPEWKASYDLASSSKELKPDPQLVELSDAELRDIESDLKKSRKSPLELARISVFEKCERMIGLCGMLLKRIAPRIYRLLKHPSKPKVGAMNERKSDTCIVTFYDKGFRMIGDLAWKSMRAYASAQKCDVLRFQDRTTDRPQSWEKIRCIQKAFDLGYEHVLWIDADAMVVDLHADIGSAFGIGSERPADAGADAKAKASADIRADFFLVRHRIDGGMSPNLGVLGIRNSERSRHILSDLWNMEEFSNHEWWEQAAFLSYFGLIGGLPQSQKNLFDTYPNPEQKRKGDMSSLCWIDERWNFIPKLGSEAGEKPVIRHYAGGRWFERVDGMVSDALACRYLEVTNAWTFLVFAYYASLLCIARVRLWASRLYRFLLHRK
jgi:lipopolysaccharide biosynthesis glycosyltransferase